MQVSQFTAIGTALAQAALLRHRLPWQMWPCGALMTGGAAMVIVPSLGHTEAGSLATARGWLGFGMAVVALITTVVYFVTLQARGEGENGGSGGKCAAGWGLGVWVLGARVVGLLCRGPQQAAPALACCPVPPAKTLSCLL